jgi:hypothetical protein
MKITNIEIKQELKRIEKLTDYYLKVKELSVLAGLVAFYAHTRDNSHDSLKKTETLAKDTIDMLVKRYKL